MSAPDVHFVEGTTASGNRYWRVVHDEVVIGWAFERALVDPPIELSFNGRFYEFWDLDQCKKFFTNL